MNSRAITLFIVALALGIGAAMFANSWIQQKMQPVAAKDGNSAPVVVAGLEIPFGQTIEKEHIRIVQLPKNSIPGTAYSEISEVEGMIANTNIFKGEIIVSKRIVDAGEGSTLAALITPKMRAMTVRVNDVIGVAGFLLPGNRVDVLSSKKVNKKARIETLLEDVKVLAVDQTASPEKDKPIVVRAVTLELDPSQAEKLVKATTEGTVQLSLRNPIDDSKKVVEKPAPAPVKKVVARKRVRKSTSHNITVIRGTQVEISKVRR
jgi:pilus assembly protein CpaB